MVGPYEGLYDTVGVKDVEGIEEVVGTLVGLNDVLGLYEVDGTPVMLGV